MYPFSFFLFAKSDDRKKQPRSSHSDISPCQENQLLSCCAGSTYALCLVEPGRLDPDAAAQSLDTVLKSWFEHQGFESGRRYIYSMLDLTL